MNAGEVDAMTRQYVATALWSSLLDDGTPMDERYGIDDVEPASYQDMAQDCATFFSYEALDLADMDAEQAGHDFWLTRNHHGAGFWDRGLGEAGDRLTREAQVYGGCDLYVGDDGRVYVS
jgi:hypothetical protein